MFVYEVTTTDGYVAIITTSGDPTVHPSFYGRVANVATIGELGIRRIQ